MITIALAGNPNCGKSTLFNRLTGERAKVGNWSGVTVERKQGLLRGNQQILLVDLPGVYSLSPCTEEEKVSRAFLLSGQSQLIINLIDARSIERGLYLTMQLLETGCPIIVAVSMLDEMTRLGGNIDCALLSRRLGVPVYPVSPKTGQGVPELLTCIMTLKDHIPAETHTLRSSVASDDHAAHTRYAQVEHLLAGEARHPVRDAHAGWRADGLFLHRLAALPLFLLIMGGMFAICFSGFGLAAKNILEKAVSTIAEIARLQLPQRGLSPILTSLLCDGIIGGVGSVICFLPQIALLFLCMGFLEESGYLARAAFLMDLPLRKLGLSGQAFIPMLMGFGCTTPAIMAARTLPGEYNRQTTIRLIPFLSCGAKLPVYAMFAGIFFPVRQGLAVLLCYLTGISAAIIYALYLKNDSKKRWECLCLSELPPYRIPSVKALFTHTGEKCIDFIKRAGSILFLISILIWLLCHIDSQLLFTTVNDHSLFAKLGGMVAPLLTPLGFGFREAAVALLAGGAAKEAIVSTLGVLCSGSSMELTALFTPLSAASFLVFCVLYAPCVSALASMRRELGSTRQMLCAAFTQTLIAYGVTLAFYQCGLLVLRLIG